VVSRFNVATAGLVRGIRVQLGSVTEWYDGDLQIELIAPDGTDVHLLDVNQTNSGHNFYNTVFDDNASTSINAIGPTGAPFTGSYVPSQPLSTFNGHQQQGTWQLKITNNSFGQPGTLNSWGASVAPAVCTTAPIGSFTATPNPAQVGATVGFDGSGSTSPTGASITGYSWNFGDGSPTASGKTTSHSYTARGKYTVALTVTDANNKTSTTTLPVSVTQPPVAAIAATPSAPVAGQTVTYDASATTHDPSGSIVDYKWDLDGSGNYATDTGTTPTVSTSYPTPRTVGVSVRVTDDVGASSVATTSVTVGDAPPVASFVAPSPILVGQSVLFDGTGSYDIDGTISNYSWNFDGNGFVSTGTTPSASHIYTTPGALTVSLRVTDDKGGTNTTTRTIQVTRPPVAQLKATPSSPSGGQVVTLDASGSTSPDGTVTAYQWDLDGSGRFANSTGSTPFLQHTFAPGTYSIKVRVADNFGAAAIASLTLTVTAPAGGGGAATLLAQVGPTIGGDPTAGVAALTGGDLKAIVAGSDNHFAAITGTPVRTAAAVAKKGLWVNLLSDRRTTFDLIVSVAAADAKRLHIAGARRRSGLGAGLRQVTSVSTSLAVAGQRPFDIKLPAALRTKLAKLRGRIQLLVTGSAVDASGHRTALSRAFQVKR
jgi:PKD repeat protein